MSRVITRSAADVVERLELDGDLLVTVDRLAAILRDLDLQADEGTARRVAYELQRDGWLGPLRTRHTWEFLPANRGGPYGSGDRFIEFRAQHAVNPPWPGVLAMESAASVLGLTQRIPRQEVVALPGSEPFPKALTGQWRHVRVALPESGRTTRNELPSWNLEGLVVGIAARPSGYQDIAGLGQWLPGAVADVDVNVVITLLEPMRAATRQRTAYLTGAAGNDDARAAIIDVYPPTETVWLGPRIAGAGHFDSDTKVNDALIHPYLSVGTGS